MQKKLLMPLLFVCCALLIPKIGFSQIVADKHIELSGRGHCFNGSREFAELFSAFFAEQKLNYAISMYTPPPGWAVKEILYHETKVLHPWTLTDPDGYLSTAIAKATIVIEWVGPLEPEPLDFF
jgi:hypothetical protein